jgi:saccharopine dehydrogenase (NAD+, L-lysine-forming)
MSIYIGIRHEDKYVMEKRAPLTPKHVEKIIKHQKLDVIVETSTKRIFKDEEYQKIGAKVSKDLKKCAVIFGVKEIPESFFEPEKTYIFFAHVAKGQQKNMAMLRKMMQLKCNLIDYEKIVDELNKRLIFFGKYAGYAGMINSLWALGLRYKEMGFETPLLKIKQAHYYNSLEHARKVISEVGQNISENGFHEKIKPLVIGFTGYGNVSVGAQEICGLLPVKEISPDKLTSLKDREKIPNNLIYKVIFKEEHLVKPVDKEKEFELLDYYSNPELYRSQFEKYVPHLSALINCMYWDERYPKLITREYLEKLYKKDNPKITVIGDITCDVNGSVESTVKSTEIEDPIYVYNPFTKDIKMGYKGEGLLTMAVDILPSELPRDSSNGFGDVLVNYIKPIAMADYELPYEELDLPRAIKKALILHKGELTHDYQYIQQYL